MLRYPCLVLDHDDTVVQSERDVNFPFFKYILNEFRPGTAVTLQDTPMAAIIRVSPSCAGRIMASASRN